MANNWNGYLIKATKTSAIFPSKYIALGSYEALPNVREEIKAYRDENTRNLTRVTAKGHKSSLKFVIRPLHLNEKMEVQKFFTDAESDKNQRKIQLQYWNDEENAYKTSYFYRPDITFKIYKISKKDIIYDAFEVELIEY